MASGMKERATGWRRLPAWARRGLIALAVVIVLAWALAPAARGVTLVINRSGRVAPDARAAGIPVREVSFSASDGVKLAGWLAIASPDSPTVILVHGFKASRVSMAPWARFLYGAGYNVLLYDSRGCGASAGWGIGVGASEPDDLIGATRFLQGYSGLTNKRFGALGVSLGAGEVILAAAREPALLAVIADSPWADERPQLDRMASLPLGPLAIPALPYEPALVDALAGTRAAPPPVSRAATATGMIVTRITNDTTTFTSGSRTPWRIWPKIQMGKLLWAPAVKVVTMTSSNDSAKASMAPATTEVEIRGSVTSRNTWKPLAPRSMAASISDPCVRRSRASTLL
jgi:pimeloyl-ACP methyl ester carboxylesterase